MSQVFAGVAGKTSTGETVVVCGGCGAWYGAAHIATINLNDGANQLRAFLKLGFSALNEVCCPRCGALYVIEEPFLVHLPERRRFILVLPERQRHRALQAQAEHLRRLAPHAGALSPPYARELQVVVGQAALKSTLRGQAQLLEPSPAAQGPMTQLLISPLVAPARDEPSSDGHASMPISEMRSPKPSEESIDEALASLLNYRQRSQEPEAPPAEVSAEAPQAEMPPKEASLSPIKAEVKPLSTPLSPVEPVAASAAQVVEPAAQVVEPAAQVVEPAALVVEPAALADEPAAARVEPVVEPAAPTESAQIAIAELLSPPPASSEVVDGPGEPKGLLESLSARLSAPEPSAVESSINRIFSEADEPLPGLEGLEMGPVHDDASMDDFDTASIDVSESDLSIEVVSEARSLPPQPKVPPPLPPHLTPSPRLGAPSQDEAARRAEDADWDSALDDAWSMDAVTQSPVDEPTHIVSLASITPPERSAPRFDAARDEGRGLYLEKEGEYVRLVAQLDPTRAAHFEAEDAQLRFQLHRTPQGGVLGLLLVNEEVEDHLFWPLAHETPLGCAILDELERFFSAEALFFEPDGALRGRRVFRILLEENVKSARAALALQEKEAAPDRAAARAAVCAEGFDRVGRLRHNFHEDSFAALNDASEVRLALGILSYWSSPERRDYLLRIKSFPESWFEAMIKRVLRGAVAFGLAIEPHLRQKTLELGLAEGPVPLLQACLANFAEVNLNLKPNGLDPLDTWENWEALLTLAEELDLQVDEEIEELAAIAMERARQAAQAAEPIDLGDGEGVVVDERSVYETLPDGDLVSMLASTESAGAAVLALLERGEAYTPALFDAITQMPRLDLQQIIPSLLAHGPRFEAAFLGALRSRRASLRLSSALFLAEIRSTKAVSPLLRLLLRADDALWPILARAIARMGRRVITPALERVARHPKNRERVAQTLALLGAEARGALRAAREQIEGDAAQWCVEQALALMGEVSFGDAADFTERLEEALSVAGQDDIRPEEDIALSPIITSDALSLLEEALDFDD
ncbi:hypothetical protein KKB55_00405 [Myxococcota bacterium]|nr:hypothetical protein [Myxococcota bacterium]MBU1896211.1 hypothetical protein [Myxococcota bacterium]